MILKIKNGRKYKKLQAMSSKSTWNSFLQKAISSWEKIVIKHITFSSNEHIS